MQDVDVGSVDVPRNEDESLRAFQRVMRKKLQENVHKGGWVGQDPQVLLRRLEHEVSELRQVVDRFKEALTSRSIIPEETAVRARLVALEAADVANFALMVADTTRGLDHWKRSET